MATEDVLRRHRDVLFTSWVSTKCKHLQLVGAGFWEMYCAHALCIAVRATCSFNYSCFDSLAFHHYNLFIISSILFVSG